MSTKQEHLFVPLGALERFIGGGIVHRIPLELDYTAGDRGLAEARVSSWIQKEADRFGLVARGADISFDLEVEDVGLFGFADPLRRTTLVGTWRLNLGPAPAYSLRYGPAHGLTGQLNPLSDPLNRTITVVGHRPGPDGRLAAIEGVYSLAGFDPMISALVYDFDGSLS